MTLYYEINEASQSSVLAEVKGSLGYSLHIKLSPDELKLIRGYVKSQWRDRIIQEYPELQGVIDDYEVDDYHLLIKNNQQIDHKKLWPKKFRIFTPKVISAIKGMSFMQRLKQQLGEFRIANEESIYDEEIYWRLVRPESSGDVGPIHADRWFWELGHGHMPEGFSRVKIWIPLYCEPGQNGLRYVPASHLCEWSYEGVHKDGFVKPCITENESDLNIQLYNTQPGEAVIFNDALLHGGATGGNKSRVSAEFTILVANEVYERQRDN